MTFSERKAVVVGLKGVSEVVSQDTLDYRPNLEKYKPDYVVHGDDWKSGIQSSIRQQVVKTLQNGEEKLLMYLTQKEFHLQNLITL